MRKKFGKQSEIKLGEGSNVNFFFSPLLWDFFDWPVKTEATKRLSKICLVKDVNVTKNCVTLDCVTCRSWRDENVEFLTEVSIFRNMCLISLE